MMSLLFPASISAQAYTNKMVFAHYLPWYDVDGSYPSSWNRRGWCYEGDCSDFSNIHYSNKPLIGEYTLSDDDVIEYHILTALMAGIDGFIINLNPSSNYQKTITTDVLDKINTLKSSYTQLNDFKVIISYDNNSADPTDIVNYFTSVYNDIYNNVSYEPLIFRDETNNKQVLITWSESDPSLYYSTANTIWGANGIQLLVRNSVNFDISDGNSQWVNGFSTPANENSNWGESYFNDFEWIVSRQSSFGLSDPLNENKVMMGMAYPGFDDGNVPSFWNGGNHRLIKRDVTAGETMSLTWDRQINYVVNGTGGTSAVENPWIQLITWNDWPEGTSIEPGSTDTYGFKPLQTNKAKVDTWKGNNGYAMNCIEVPYLIYSAKKEGFNTQAASGMALMMSGDCAAARTLLEPLLPIPLPLEIISIESDCNENEAVMTWETAMEENLSYFEIQILERGENWETLGNIQAKNKPSQYAYEIKKNGYYRLKIVEQDGKIEYSDILEINCLENEFIANVYPNPTRNDINISLNASNETEGILQIRNILGETIFQEKYHINKGENLLQIQKMNVSTGIFHINLIIDDKIINIGGVCVE